MSRASLWSNRDFLKLWIGQTVSQLGTLMGALQLVAVLLLHATPLQMGVLAAINLAPGLTLGLVAGAWVDRLRRRSVLIFADLGRALLLASLPVTWLAGVLRMEQLYVVAFGAGALTIFFDVAYRSYLPSLVDRSQLVEANSKLTGSESAVEVTAFSVGGWIAQLFGAMVVAVIDAISFLVSGLVLASIGRRESLSAAPQVCAVSSAEPGAAAPKQAAPAQGQGRPTVLRDIGEGLAAVWNEPHLRTIGGITLVRSVAGGIIGALIILYGIDELGFSAGALGSLFAIGGISAIGGALTARRLSERFGRGRVMVVGRGIAAASTFLLPLAHGPLLLAGILLGAAQLIGDGPAAIYEINEMSLRQSLTADRLLGRVNASLRVVELGALLLGSLAAGLLGQWLGLRLSLLVAACVSALGWGWLALSPLRRL